MKKLITGILIASSLIVTNSYAFKLSKEPTVHCGKFKIFKNIDSQYDSDSYILAIYDNHLLEALDQEKFINGWQESELGIGIHSRYMKRLSKYHFEGWRGFGDLKIKVVDDTTGAIKIISQQVVKYVPDVDMSTITFGYGVCSVNVE